MAWGRVAKAEGDAKALGARPGGAPSMCANPQRRAESGENGDPRRVGARQRGDGLDRGRAHLRGGGILTRSALVGCTTGSAGGRHRAPRARRGAPSSRALGRVAPPQCALTPRGRPGDGASELPRARGAPEGGTASIEAGRI